MRLYLFRVLGAAVVWRLWPVGAAALGVMVYEGLKWM
jgi:hypothetical protein